MSPIVVLWDVANQRTKEGSNRQLPHAMDRKKEKMQHLKESLKKTTKGEKGRKYSLQERKKKGNKTKQNKLEEGK